MADNDERCCTCTTPEYTIKLNKQGPQGLTGPQGEPGFSPVIEVSEETPTSYRLSIQTIDGSYETPNLKANFPLGGYVNQVLVKQSNADGDATWDYIPYATTELTGGLQLATTDDIVSGSTKAITGDILASVIAGYVDKTSTQTITGAKTFNNNLTVGDSYTLSTHYLNVRSGEIGANGTTVIAKENDDISIPGYSSLIRVGGNLPLLIKGSSDVVRIWRDGSSHIIVDADNIGDYIPSNVVTKNNSGYITVNGISGLSEIWSSNAEQILRSYEFNGNYYLTLSTVGKIILQAGGVNPQTTDNVQVRRGNDYYTVLDSGNISQDAYIQSLVARIEALELGT